MSSGTSGTKNRVASAPEARAPRNTNKAIAAIRHDTNTEAPDSHYQTMFRSIVGSKRRVKLTGFRGGSALSGSGDLLKLRQRRPDGLHQVLYLRILWIIAE